MNPANLRNISTFLWIFLLFRLNAVISAATIITECRLGHSIGSEFIPWTGTVEFRCSSNSQPPQRDISAEVCVNATTLHCTTGATHVDNINALLVRECNVDMLPVGLLKHFKNLTELYIDGLFLVELRQDDLPILAVSETSPTTLRVSNNSLTFLPNALLRNQSGVKHLYVNDNRLYYISAEHLAGVPNLELLALSSNRLARVAEGTFRHLSLLKRLELCHNQIEHIDGPWFGADNTLAELELSHNLISSLSRSDFASLKQLRLLNLAANRIVSIESGTFDSLPQLESLYLRDNQLSSVGEWWLGEANALQHLDLSMNNITELKRNEFAHMKELLLMNVSASQVKTIEPGTFGPLQQLGTLDLTENRLTEFEYPKVFSQTPDGVKDDDVTRNFGRKSNSLQQIDFLTVFSVLANRVGELYFDDKENQLTGLPNHTEARATLDVHVERNQFNCTYLRGLAWRAALSQKPHISLHFDAFCSTR